MKHLYRLTLSAAVLVMALAVSIPSVVDARPEKRGHGRSSEVRGDRPGKREVSRGAKSRPSGARAQAPRASKRERADWRYSSSRGATPRGEVRHRSTRVDSRADVRWRDSGRRSDAPTYRSRTSYRHDGWSEPRYRTRSYYTGSFHRPRFVYRSGFSLGFVIASVPSYGYRYFDPYCDRGFSNLDVYYDHCDYHGHPSAILILDFQSGYPIASCVHSGGYWVVDDCY
jgi:hypothetical protein